MTLKFDRFTIQWLMIRDLEVHPKIQREYREWHAKEIAEAFDPDLFNPLAVIERGKKYLVFEGQHRLGAARMALGEDQRIPCHVHEDAPLEQQAKIALGQRRTLAWKRLEEWAVRVIAREEIPLKVEAILHRHNLTVSKTAGEGVVQAIVAVEAVYMKHGGEATLDRVLNILVGAYGRDRHALDGALIRGAALLVHRLGDHIDDSDLAAKLSRHSGAVQMVAQAKDYAKVNSVSLARGMAEKMIRVYNQGRRVGGVRLSLDLQ